MPPQHLVATSPALASPVGSATSPNCSTPPCSTLFVANLGQFVSEQELKDMFGRYNSYFHWSIDFIYANALILMTLMTSNATNVWPTVLYMSLYVLNSFPGFCRLRMHNKGGAPVAFVEYTVSDLIITILSFFIAQPSTLLLLSPSTLISIPLPLFLTISIPLYLLWYLFFSHLRLCFPNFNLVEKHVLL